MVPQAYNMVSLDNLDLAEANGDIVDGIYSKILDAVDACGVLMIVNWRFAGVPIPPSYCSILQFEGYITLNGAIKITSSDEVFIEAVYPDPIITPVQFTENGEYEAPAGVDGYNPVTVEVPEPVIVPVQFTENGEYEAPAGVDGYNPVTVSVGQPGVYNPILGGFKCSASSSYSNRNPEFALRGGDNSWWGAATNSGWIKIEMPSSVRLQTIKMAHAFVTNGHWWSKGVTVEASNDDSTWTTILSLSDLDDVIDQFEYQIQDNTSYKFYKFTCNPGGSFYVGLGSIEFLI